MPRRKDFKPWELKGVHALPHGKGTRVNILVRDYMFSDKWANLTNATKKNYTSCIRSLESLILSNASSLMVMHAHRVDYGTADYIKRVLGFYLRPATISQYFSLLSSVWELALRNGKVAINPWAKSGIRIKNIRDTTWSTQQINIGIKTSLELGYDLLALYIQLSYETALRPWSDLRHLKWENIKLDKDGQIVLDIIIQKTGVHLLLPLSKAATDILNTLPKISEYVFVNSEGSHLTQSTLTEHFIRMKRIAMLDNSLLIRDLRRTAVTEMAMSGATVSEITAATGWKVSQSIINRYAVIKQRTAKNCVTKREEFQNEQSEPVRPSVTA